MKTLKISVIIVFFLFDSLLMADEWTIVGQLNVGRDQGYQSVLLSDGTDRVGAHKTASTPQRSVAGSLHASTRLMHSKIALQRGTPKKWRYR